MTVTVIISSRYRVVQYPEDQSSLPCPSGTAGGSDQKQQLYRSETAQALQREYDHS